MEARHSELSDYDLHPAYVARGPSPMCVLVPVFLVLLPALLEFGFVMNAAVSLNRAAADVGALAAAGASPEVIAANVGARRGGVDGRFVQCVALRSDWDPAHHRWSSWRHLGMAEGQNNAATGERIMVRLEYHHPLLLGSLLAPLFGASADNTVSLEAATEVARR
ncbi:MAG: hypothetical protein ACOX9R_13095 [Armatimonadota bacterium]|jgi:hypothetical protein